MQHSKLCKRHQWEWRTAARAHQQCRCASKDLADTVAYIIAKLAHSKSTRAHWTNGQLDPIFLPTQAQSSDGQCQTSKCPRALPVHTLVLFYCY